MVKPLKVEIYESFPDPFLKLIDICGSISPPSYQKFKSMLKNYKVVDGTLWFSIFIQKWPDFYHLPALLENAKEKYTVEYPHFSNLCSSALDDIMNCQQLIEDAVESKPDGPNEQSLQLEAFYDQNTKDIHKRLTRICTQLNNYYLPEFLKGQKIKNNQLQANHSLDFRSVHWYGTDHSFTAMQAAIVKELWNACENGTPDIGQSALLEKVDSQSKRLVDVFKSHKTYKQLIGEGKTKGSYQLIIPSQEK
ncbi:MAG: hypothetical protein ACQ9MH_27505 [Nitrospinales bacterium]